MKLLIAYDGSRCAEAAIDDLVQSGLPPRGDALVISVSEVWLSPPAERASFKNKASQPDNEDGLDHGDSEIGALNESRMLSEHAKGRVQNILSDWAVSAIATAGS